MANISNTLVEQDSESCQGLCSHSTACLGSVYTWCLCSRNHLGWMITCPDPKDWHLAAWPCLTSDWLAMTQGKMPKKKIHRRCTGKDRSNNNLAQMRKKIIWSLHSGGQCDRKSMAEVTWSNILYYSLESTLIIILLRALHNIITNQGSSTWNN